MSYRPLVLVIGLTLGDYLLWDWSLGGNHEVLALVSGVTLVPLALGCVWLIAINLARLLNRGRQRVAMEPLAREADEAARRRQPATATAAGSGHAPAARELAASAHERAGAPTKRARSSRKIAA